MVILKPKNYEIINLKYILWFFLYKITATICVLQIYYKAMPA